MSICLDIMGFHFEGTFTDVVRDILVTLGNSVGQFISVPCPICGEWSQISSYGGNVVDGNATCPKCGECICE